MQNIKNIYFSVGFLVCHLFGFGLIAAEKSESEIENYYTILGIEKGASLEDIELAYHRCANKQHYIIRSFSSAYISYADEHNHYIKLYGFVYLVDKDKYLYYENNYSRDRVFEAKENLQKIRKAYEYLSQNHIEKIKFLNSELDTRGLSQQDICIKINKSIANKINIEKLKRELIEKYRCFYGMAEIVAKKRYASDHIENFEQFVQDERKKNKLEPIQQQEDYFYIGENDQNIIWLSSEDQQKSQALLESRTKKEDRRIGMQSGQAVAIAGAILIAGGLIARTIFLEK